MTAAIIILASLGFGATTTIALDPELARLLNTVVNFATLFLLYRHNRQVRTRIQPKVDHLDSALRSSRAGGRREMDSPVDPA